MRFALFFYGVMWWAFLPLVLLYLHYRSIKDPAYRERIGERFGYYLREVPDSVWVHAVSLGEMRSAGPLIRALLDRGEHVVTTHFTPAGRKAALNLFGREIRAGKLTAVYVPFELGFCYRRFFKAFSPRYGLSMEVEMWPRMIASAHNHKVPLFMCNAQYPERSFIRDSQTTGLRGELVRGFAGAFVKSETQAERFRALGQNNISVTGELRFEQPIPEHLLNAANRLMRENVFEDRPVVTIASSVQGEDEQYLRAFQRVQAYADQKGYERPVFIHVPRAPERFAEVGDMFEAAGQKVLRRSSALSDDLEAEVDLDTTDILLGDSMGEMYFYLSLARVVIVGGGFHPKGAHNVIEPLALEKPVLVGPEIWTIEFPAVEAIKAGVVLHTQTINELSAKIIGLLYGQGNIERTIKNAAKFNLEHSGATNKTLADLPVLLREKGYTS